MDEVIGELMLNTDFITYKPYVFFGHSLGSQIALQLTQSIYDKGLRLPEQLLVSASRAAHLSPIKTPTYTLSDDQFKNELRNLNGTHPEILENDEFMEILLPMLKADFKIAETTISNPTQLPIPIHIFAGTKDEKVSQSDLLAWQELTTKPIDISYIEGDHFFVEYQKEELLKKINKLLYGMLVSNKLKQRLLS